MANHSPKPDNYVGKKTWDEAMSGVAAVQPAGQTREPADNPARGNGGDLRTDGPTVAQYVEAGYSASNYPPEGYASNSSEEEIADARAAEEADLSKKTVAQLRAYAQEKGYDLGDATKKDDIIAAIELAEGN